MQKSVEELTRTLVFDESGNLGISGRYFVIACIDTTKEKSLHNIMRKKIGQAKKKFPDMKCDTHEIKASNAYPAVKHHILESIAKKDLTISYIVADLDYVYNDLLDDKNCTYNYLTKMLIDKVISNNDKNQKIKLKLDNKTVKVRSENSFKEYIKIHLNYQRLMRLDLKINHIDSNARDGYTVQAADYVANAIYTYYEYGNKYYYDLIESCINKVELFPRNKFGSNAV